MGSKSFPSAEFEIINQIQQLADCCRNDSYEIGIGDDAAVRCAKKGEKLILTTDISVEEVHFTLKTMSLQEAAYRAMVSNISDCAAMGARPDSALVQLVFPGDCSDLKQRIHSVYSGFAQACSRWQFPIVGGDLSRGQQWIFGITFLGNTVEGQRILKRRGARDGDNLWVSGFPGRSAAGFEVLKRWGRDNFPQVFSSLVFNHIKPVPRIEAGLILASDPEVHALMDLSDGLSKDCRTLSYENDLGITLKLDSLQIPEPMIKLSADVGISLQEWYLHGGEDYELLFAASSRFDPFSIRPEFCDGLFCIGQFTSKHSGLFLENGGLTSEVSPGSWDHFRN
ncbi:MAG TPA: thiamine-phosphate kinase [Chitinispirillaceae bacterium]|nr:thiamine-phosphate kinase [Chitinispirillaceae bacterium]